MKKALSDKAELARLYIDEGRTLKEMSTILGVSHTGVRQAMVRHNIQLRGHGPSPRSGADKVRLKNEMERAVIRIKEEIARFPKPMRKKIIQGFIFSECRVYPDVESALQATGL